MLRVPVADADADKVALLEGPGSPCRAEPAEAAELPAGVHGHRHVVVALCFLCSVLCYADRTNLSVALVPMQREYGWDHRTSGDLLAAFFCGYVWTQIPGGMLAAAVGAKTTLLVGVIVWSALTVATPACAGFSTSLLVAVRVCVGLAEGVAIPALMALVGAWSPPGERSRALALVSSGQFVGTIAAFGSAPLADTHWPSIFYLFGGAGFVWSAAFALLVTSRPGEHGPDTAAEKALLTPAAKAGPARAPAPGAGGAQLPRRTPTPWLRLAREPAFLCVCAAHFANNWGHYLLLSWLPRYLTSLGLRLDSAATLFVAPYAAAVVVDNAGGWIADELLQRRLRWSVRATRKAVQAVASGAPALCFVALCATRDAKAAAALLSVAVSASSLSHSGYLANLLDIAGGCPALSANLAGVANTVGTLPGILANGLTGRILEAGGGWHDVFALTAAIYVVGSGAFLRYAQGHAVFDAGARRAYPLAPSGRGPFGGATLPR